MKNYNLKMLEAKDMFIGKHNFKNFCSSKDEESYDETIYDIKIDDNTGIVYISTSRGLCSYQSDISSEYGTLEEDNIYAYPNPVSPDYTGPITIKGLYEQCQIKITTSSGYIVHKGVVSGGTYTWDGCDFNGDRVASGVYMVLIETPEGSKGCVTKIAMIK